MLHGVGVGSGEVIVGVASGEVVVGVGVSEGGLRVNVGVTDGSSVNVAWGMAVGVEMGVGVGGMQPTNNTATTSKTMILFISTSPKQKAPHPPQGHGAF